MCSHRILPILSKFRSFCFACIAIFILPTLFPTDLSAVVYTPPIIHASQDATIKASVPNENRGVGTPFYVQQSFGLCSFDFSTQGFTPELGTWAISNGRYHVSAGPSRRISLGRVHCNDCDARVTARTGSGSTYPNNGFIIFDHTSSSDYKLAGFNAETGKWVIGEMVSGAFIVKATAARTFQQSTDYTFDVRLVSSTKTVTITLSGSQSPIVSYTFSTLNASRISLGTVFSKEGWFDDFDVFLGGPGTEAEDRALIKFDQAQIASEIGTAQLVQAKLWVYIEKSQWADSGHNILAHRLTSDWSENNVTWNCASDSNTSNGFADCASQWAGGSFISQPTASVLHAHDQTGWVAFDVTADVNSFLSGTANYGWLLKKNAEPDRAYGVISYTSRDGTPVNTPNLMLYVQDDTPPSITPVINPAANGAGWNNSEVTVSFVCSDTGSGIQTCPAPITVSDEGVHQLDSGPATDKAGNSASTTVTINVDFTQADLSILSPVDGAVLHQTTVQLSGATSDSLSGISAVTCNTSPANYSAGSYNCNVSLVQGLNNIAVTTVDAAGNMTIAERSITYTSQSQNTYTFPPTGDVGISNTYYYGSGSNYGLNTYMTLESSGDESGVLVQFSPDEILSSVGTQRLTSARLELYIQSNHNDWGSGAILDAHRMLAGWEEAGVTFDCWPVDNDLMNPLADCDDLWSGGYYEDYPTASLFQQDAISGQWVSFDVTSDLQLVQNGYDTYGWIVRKRHSTDDGSLDFTSKQGNQAQRPRLIVVADDGPICPAASIESTSPGAIPADGSNITITVSGQNLDHITQLFLDGAVINYFLLDPNTITFSLSSATPKEYQLSFTSDCLNERLPVQSILSVDNTSQPLSATVCASPDRTCTFFSLGNQGSGLPKPLCWNGKPTRLIGYSGDFDYITRNLSWPSENTTIVQRYMTRAQYASNSSVPNSNPPKTASYGTNFIRVVATGGSCNTVLGPANCKGYLNRPETMPWSVTNGKYNVQMLDNSTPPKPKTDGSTLSSVWKNRLKNFIKYADENGIAVMIDLFDENLMGAGLVPGTSHTRWSYNPWNAGNSNLTAAPKNCTSINGINLATLSDGLPTFYKIFRKDDPTKLNCLGQIQMNYVLSVVNWVKNSKICAIGHCKNVIFEVMNEARYDNGWTGVDALTKDEFKKWHDRVATWIKSVGDPTLTSAKQGFLVAANVKHEANATPCVSGSGSDYCLMQNCTATSCSDVGAKRNYFTPFLSPRINIVSLHAGTWLDPDGPTPGDICAKDGAALDFNKPVIFDDDGDNKDPQTYPTPKNWLNNTWLKKWSLNVSETGTNSCTNSNSTAVKGTLHFYHTKDGAAVEGSSPNFKPVTCRQDDTGPIDCFALNAIADGIAEKLCGAAPLTSCAQRVNYCESYSGNPSGCTPVQDGPSTP